MMSMVERVARAICNQSGFEPDSIDWETVPENESLDGWRNWFGFKPEALAAIEAMREPTDAMVDAKRNVDFIDAGEPDDIAEWRAMIDAALNEQVSG